jgi:hypothetical protein
MERLFDTDTGAVLYERLFDAVDPVAWDRFVLASGGSFMGGWKVIAAEGITRAVRIFEIISSGTKIAQCAVAITHRRARFLDRLHILPAEAHQWAWCVQAVIDRCGAASYRYGSFWNHERRCPRALATSLGGARVIDGAFGVDRIDFSAWRDFAAYRRGISENIRRDYKKAASSSPLIVTRRGIAAVRDVPGLVRLRHEVMRRNREPFSAMSDGPRHVLKLLALGDDAFISTVSADRVLHGSFFGVRFGDGIYYLGGGTSDRSQGFGSYLFLTLIEAWFAAHPRGSLYLGENIPNVDPSTYTTGNLLYRRKLRAEVIPGTMFRLDVG